MSCNLIPLLLIAATFAEASSSPRCKIPKLSHFFDGTYKKLAMEEYNLYNWHQQDALHKRPQAPIEDLVDSDTFLIRHAQSAHNEGYKIYGSKTNTMPIFMDPFLSQQGKVDASGIADIAS